MPPPAPPGTYQAPPPPTAAYAQPGAAYPVAGRNNQKALISLILSIISLFVCGLIGIAGIILGSSAKKEIRQTGEQGEGLATAGQIIGIISVILWVALPLIIFLGVMGALLGSHSYG